MWMTRGESSLPILDLVSWWRAPAHGPLACPVGCRSDLSGDLLSGEQDFTDGCLTRHEACNARSPGQDRARAETSRGLAHGRRPHLYLSWGEKTEAKCRVPGPCLKLPCVNLNHGTLPYPGSNFCHFCLSRSLLIETFVMRSFVKC